MMENSYVKACGCKGIRTCLICEKQGALMKKIPSEEEQDRAAYNYCHRCNKCWPGGRHSDNGEPCELTGILLIPDFVSDEEQQELISRINGIPWLPSQSGRNKQDFGPKVNFKKRKVKVGNFCGFPDFAAGLFPRLCEIRELSDFRPVELCNLEYVPERGSAIEPHLDDSWLWGERLVTLNLLSDAVLTLTPVEGEVAAKCGCCETFFSGRWELRSSDSVPNDSSVQCSTASDVISVHTCVEELPAPNSIPSVERQRKLDNDDYNDRNNSALSACAIDGRNSDSQRKFEVRIHLPSKSLLVLSSCARHHWYHEIKRKDITSRRLAMTFRELSEEFEEGGSEEEIGKELLLLAQNVIYL